MFKDVDPNRMSYFELKSMVDDLGYQTFSKLYYRDLDSSFTSGLKFLISNNEIGSMLNDAKNTGA